MHADPQDDTLTLIALGAVAFILAGTVHEAIGHGLTALMVGGTPVLLTSSYFLTTGHYSRWIPADGGIANVIVGLLALACTRLSFRPAPSVSYFVVLLAAFNLLFAAAYPFYSGVALFGDWAAVIAGLSPPWAWRTLLIVSSISLYWLFLRWVAIAIRPFCERTGHHRLRRITLIPFWSALVIASIAGAFNPAGWTNIFVAAAPAAAASFGFTQLDHFRTAFASGQAPHVVGTIPQSTAWIAAAALGAAFFVIVLGRGIHFH